MNADSAVDLKALGAGLVENLGRRSPFPLVAALFGVLMDARRAKEIIGIHGNRNRRQGVKRGGEAIAIAQILHDLVVHRVVGRVGTGFVLDPPLGRIFVGRKLLWNVVGKYIGLGARGCCRLAADQEGDANDRRRLNMKRLAICHGPIAEWVASVEGIANLATFDRRGQHQIEWLAVEAMRMAE